MFTVLVTSMCMASNVAISHDNVIEHHNEGRGVYGAGNGMCMINNVVKSHGNVTVR
jgi:hypothetical protein